MIVIRRRTSNNAKGKIRFTESNSDYNRFEQLTRSVIKVPKAEIDAKQETLKTGRDLSGPST